ncbi:hypothetical protein ES703_49709 [subsurface metagenome]
MNEFDENQILSTEDLLLIKLQEIDEEANRRSKEIYEEADLQSKKIYKDADHQSKDIYKDADHQSKKIYEEADLKKKKIYDKIIRRREMKEDYDKTAFRLKKRKTRHVFSVLQESGGSYRFTEILHFVRGSSSTLTIALNELRNIGLVRFEGGLYSASSPAWFAKQKREQKEKTKDTSINRSKPA